MKITLADCYAEEGFKITVNQESLKFEEKSIDLFQNYLLICWRRPKCSQTANKGA